jgi:hypothetical protein
VESNLQWSDANEVEYYQDLAIPYYQFHYDQEKTYGGYRFMYSHSKDELDGWKRDGEVFYAYHYGRPEDEWDIVKVNRYHKAQ